MYPRQPVAFKLCAGTRSDEFLLFRPLAFTCSFFTKISLYGHVFRVVHKVQKIVCTMFHGGALIVHGEFSRVYRSIEVPYSRKSQTFLAYEIVILFCVIVTFENHIQLLVLTMKLIKLLFV